MRALAAYLTVILCCGFYKDKQLPAYLSLKSSSISAFCKIFSAKNPYPITVRTEMGLRKPPRHRSVPPASPNTSGPTGASNPSGMTHRIKKNCNFRLQSCRFTPSSGKRGVQRANHLRGATAPICTNPIGSEPVCTSAAVVPDFIPPITGQGGKRKIYIVFLQIRII